MQVAAAELRIRRTLSSVGYHRRVPNGISVNAQINFDKSPYSFRCKQSRMAIINRVVDSGLICSFGLSASPPFISDNVNRLQWVFSTDNFFSSTTDRLLFNLRNVCWKQRFGTETFRAAEKQRENGIITNERFLQFKFGFDLLTILRRGCLFCFFCFFIYRLHV